MKITDAYNQFSASTVATTAAQGAKPVGKHGGAGVHHHPKDDSAKVDVSDAAKALAAKSTADTARLDRLRSAIQNGTFEVDAQKIAEKMIGGDES